MTIEEDIFKKLDRIVWDADKELVQETIKECREKVLEWCDKNGYKEIKEKLEKVLE